MNPFLSRNTYLFLFSLLAVVYIIGLFVPLMDNDSAHHANIALHMHLTGDYVNLVDNGKDYLDKPHLLFWLCTMSYKVFGVTTFAYKLPSFLFTIAGIYSVYKLGKELYNNEVGKLAALVIASSFAFILSNNDVRMEAILTACVAFSTWQGVAFINHKRIINTIGLGFGLALGFCAKGHIAVFTPAIGLFFYLLYKKQWSLLYNWKSIVALLFFVLFISPVVYCYYLQFNLHPEKIINGKDHINGVRFILLDQSIERFGGQAGVSSKKDYLFFIHSFLWAFAPWSIVCFWAIIDKFKKGVNKSEWLTAATIIIMAIVVGLSGFKLPHYLNIVFPAASVLTAGWLLDNIKREKIIYRIQLTLAILILLVSAVLNFWFFPINNYLVVGGMIFLLAVFFHFIRSKIFSSFQKAIGLSISALALLFFLYNSNYSPQLLTYQCGKEFATKIKGKINSAEVYFWRNNYSSSFNFYTSTLRKEFADSLLDTKEKVWIQFDKNYRQEILNSGYMLKDTFDAPDYEITKADLKFLNPATRKKVLSRSFIAEISRAR